MDHPRLASSESHVEVQRAPVLRRRRMIYRRCTQIDAEKINEEKDKLTEAIIGSAFRVSNTLGCGFLEKVYENALAFELKINGLKCEQQKPIPVTYKGLIVSDYYADILVEGEVIL